ncbi:MAG: hypothetical protein JSV91_01160 [Phycisphaerales bacterium]|nr:MAG: hypothetical protein JSV91_01160 [Phycisphaerales bacterium]
MAAMDEPIQAATPPFEPDEHGYCYRHRREFDQVMTDAAARLIESRLLFGRWTGTLLWLVCMILLGLGALFFFASPRAFGSPSGRVDPAFGLRWIGWLVPSVYACWLSTRSRRLGRKVAARRLCLNCGYSLLGAPTDEDGWGTCSECSARFNAAYYRRPEPAYRRDPDTYIPALSIEQLVHPYDIARMQADADEQRSQDEEQS